MTRILVKMGVVSGLIAGALALSAGPVSAGGWAMTSLDAAPSPVAGRALAVGFTIRQHGVRPVNPTDGQVGINVKTATGAEEFFPGTAQGQPGHYVAQVRIDAPGATTWQVLQGWFGPQDLGRIDVAGESVATVGATQGASGSTYRGSLLLRVLLPVIGIGLGAFAVVDALTARRRRVRDPIAT